MSTAAASGLTVTVLPTGAAVAVPLVVDAAAHRIVQESITNVLRHSASVAGVRARSSTGRGRSRLRISNPAAGAACCRGECTTGAGFGIAGMRERAELLGGTLRAGPTADGGFEVRAVLPFPAPS